MAMSDCGSVGLAELSDGMKVRCLGLLKLRLYFGLGVAGQVGGAVRRRRQAIALDGLCPSCHVPDSFRVRRQWKARATDHESAAQCKSGALAILHAA